METEAVDVGNFQPKKATKKRAKPTEVEEEMQIDEKTGIEGKTVQEGAHKAKRTKKSDSQKIAVPIKR